MSKYPDYRQSQTGYEKESKTIDQDDIIRALQEENERLREEVEKLQDFTSWLWSGCFGHVENIRGNIVDIYEDWERGKFDREKKEQGHE